MIGLLELRVGLSITSVMLGYIKGSWMQVREVLASYNCEEILRMLFIIVKTYPPPPHYQNDRRNVRIIIYIYIFFCITYQ